MAEIFDYLANRSKQVGEMEEKIDSIANDLNEFKTESRQKSEELSDAIDAIMTEVIPDILEGSANG